MTDTYNTGKGYAFVTFENRDDALNAIDNLNERELFGQKIKVCTFSREIRYLQLSFRLLCGMIDEHGTSYLCKSQRSVKKYVSDTAESL